jgi:hypothetical protein
LVYTAIGDELFFNIDIEERSKDDSSVPVSINRGHVYQRSGSSPGNSLCGTEASDGKKSKKEAMGSSYSSSVGDNRTQGRF